jgi:hypothetical protein
VDPVSFAGFLGSSDREHAGNSIVSIRMFRVDAAGSAKSTSEYPRRLIWKNQAPPDHRCAAYNSATAR